MAGSEDSYKCDQAEGCDENEIPKIVVSTECEPDVEIAQSIATPQIFNREDYLQVYKNIVNQSKLLLIRNNILHRKLAVYYKKRNLEHVLKPFQGTVDLEGNYQQKLLSYEVLKEKAVKETADIWAIIAELEKNFTERLEHAKEKFIALQDLERSTGTGLIYSKKGKPIADKTVSKCITLQARKSEQASVLSLRYIRARNAIAELEAVIKKIEMLRPGLYVYHYQELKADNQNYKNKIEDREDDLIRIRSKYISHFQSLAHIREKMDHMEEQIDVAECDFGESEIAYKHSRENLGVEKVTRNKIRWLLQLEEKKAGLLTKKDLLRDFQNAMNEVVALRKKKQVLEARITNTRQELIEARKSINRHHSQHELLSE